MDIDVQPHVASEPSGFRFEVELDTSTPLAVFEDAAQFHARFRHFHDDAIELAPGITGLNLGIQLYRARAPLQMFEDRMVIDTATVEPGVWTSASVRIPRSVLNFRDTYRIVVDFVREDEFWFANTGQIPFEAEIRFVDGMRGQFRSDPVATEGSFAAAQLLAGLGTAGSDGSATDTGSAATVHLVFDVSDLIQYFHNARLPTGIQRVQIEIITNLIFSMPEDCSLKIGCFTKASDTWIDIPTLFFNHICKLALVNGDPTAPDWIRVLEELRMQMEQAKRLVFRRGSYLINLGTSWWLQNYFLNVRAAKARYGIRYVPYVHDCIPIMTPEHCVEGLTRDFITWALGAFQHADHVMVNSRATAKDVKLVARHLGHEIGEPSVVTLDADYRAANARLPTEFASPENSEIFLKNDIRAGDYVLFVSTIESRKNHLMAFSAWLALVKKYGPRRVPKLVCVGNRGWLNDAIYGKLAASKLLQQKVSMLSKISDPDLELLYRNCLFTLYPSSYEGWGLPVTESLCFGKVPVLANASSLPESGGEFGEYFDLGSESELLQVLERMIFDADYRASRERLVAERFRPRTWSAIADNVVSLARGWAATDPPVDLGREAFTDRALWPFPAKLGRYYGLTENEETQIWPDMVAGEMFRQGDGWWWTEPWGCWTKAKVARLAFLAPLPTEGGAVVFVGIRGVQRVACTATVTIEDVGTRRVRLDPEQTQWLVFRIAAQKLRALPRASEGLLFDLLFASDQKADFRELTGGVDHRVASIGVCGFMVCAEDDFAARLRFIESVALKDLQSLLSEGRGGKRDSRVS